MDEWKEEGDYIQALCISEGLRYALNPGSRHLDLSCGRKMVLQTSTGKWTLVVALAGVAAAAVGYAVYFDHKRRHDVSFRKQLRTQACG